MGSRTLLNEKVEGIQVEYDEILSLVLCSRIQRFQRFICFCSATVRPTCFLPGLLLFLPRLEVSSEAGLWRYNFIIWSPFPCKVRLLVTGRSFTISFWRSSSLSFHTHTHCNLAIHKYIDTASLINFSSYRCRVSLIKTRKGDTRPYKIHRYPAIYLYHVPQQCDLYF